MEERGGEESNTGLLCCSRGLVYGMMCGIPISCNGRGTDLDASTVTRSVA